MRRYRLSSEEFFDRFCKLLCESNKLIKEYLFGPAIGCGFRLPSDQRWSTNTKMNCVR